MVYTLTFAGPQFVGLVFVTFARLSRSVTVEVNILLALVQFFTFMLNEAACCTLFQTCFPVGEL